MILSLMILSTAFASLQCGFTIQFPNGAVGRGWLCGIDLDPPIGGTSLRRRRLPAAHAARHYQGEAVDPFARQLDLHGALTVGIVTQELPGLPLVARHPDLDLAAAGARRLVQL